MDYSVQNVDQVLIMMLEGKLINEQQTAQIRERIMMELVVGKRYFIFDLKSLEFVNSACLNLLVASKNKIAEQGGVLILCNISDQLKKLLAMTRLESYFTIADRTGDALSFLKQLNKG